MSDFTKDELQILSLEMSIVINRITQEGLLQIPSIYFELRDKIQSMIDNYCEHEYQDYPPGTAAIPYCIKCKRALL